jgi:uncharacterized protein YndB with AHSA1/START domain
LTTRLIILSLATLFLASVCIGFLIEDSYHQGFLFFLLSTLVGIGAIAFTIHSYEKTTLEGHLLKVEYFFGATKRLDLLDLEEWQERGYFIRGKQRKHLILFFPHDQRILISNNNHVAEYEKLSSFLKSDPVTMPLDASPDRRVTVTRVLDFSPQQLFNAFTDPKQLSNWWAPAEALLTFNEHDLQVGGKWNFDVHGLGGRVRCDFVFSKISAPHFIAWHDAGTHFKTNALFRPKKVGQTKLFITIIFPSIEECKLSGEATSLAMEERLQRLEDWLKREA